MIYESVVTDMYRAILLLNMYNTAGTENEIRDIYGSVVTDK
jgi:hypothetical protein